jgi:site-specific recombinase XerD
MIFGIVNDTPSPRRPQMSNPPTLTLVSDMGSRPLPTGDDAGSLGAMMLIRKYENYLLSRGRARGTIARRVADIEHLRLWHPDLLTVTTEDLENRLAGMFVSGLKAEARKNVRASYRVFYSWAHNHGHLVDDPAAALDPIKIPVTVPRLAPDDVTQIALVGAPLRERGMVLLARLACLRLSEFTTLHTRDRERDALRIRGKGDKERLVFINDDLMPTLLELEAVNGGGYYFPGRFGGHLHPQSAEKIVVRCTGWNPHSFRHAGATAAYQATHDLRAVQEMLGHSSMETTQRYLHTNETAARAVSQGTSFRSPVDMGSYRGLVVGPVEKDAA